MLHNHHAVQCLHDPLLLVLSYLVSVLGAFTALQLAVAIPAARNAAQRLRAVVLAGTTMGGGAIWAMHFIAMLACQTGIPVTYDLTLTVLSALIAIAACALGLGIAGIGMFSGRKLLAAGVFMGLGVAGMHYTGMAAMRMPAEIHYHAAIVAVSIAIAIAASIAALWLAFKLRGWAQMLGSALVMGVAVCGMHYTGMYAASYVPNGEDVLRATAGGIGGEHLGAGIFGITTLLLAATLVMATLRRHRDRRAAAAC